VTEFTDLLVRAVPVLLGAGTVQIIIALLRRRQEVRAADVAAVKTASDTDAVVVASAERSLILSDQVRDRAVKRAEVLIAELQHAEAEVAAMRVEARELRVEVASLTREVGILRARLAAMSPPT